MVVNVHETATVDEGAIIGSGTNIWHYAHVRGTAVIGKDCNVGHCVYIDQNVKIGSNVKIGNKASIFQGVEIGNGCFIGPHVAFTNDKRPRSLGSWEIVRTTVMDGASIGANSTILCGVTLGSDCMVGSGSVVTRDVPQNALVYGNPAKVRGFVCSCGNDAEKSSKKGRNVAMKCVKCGKAFEIPEDVYTLCGD